MLPLFSGKVESGKVIFDDKGKFNAWVRRLEGQNIQVSIGKPKSLRTAAENNYYWGVIVKILSEEMGLIPDETHELLKSLFLKKGIEYKGKRWEIVGSTAKLTIKQFEEYCELCRNWAMVQNITLPLPNEIIIDEF